MADKKVPAGRKTTIEIPVPSVRKYVPGSGPPPPRISLVPPRDSTAYIIDQFVLPTEEETTETSRRLIHYHIGFTDLPTVKLLIPCTEVLDYVSPRELEDWEYKNSERREEERARELAKKQRASAAAKEQAALQTEPREDGAGSPGPSAADEALLLAQQVAGPSLSTPQKRRLGEVLDEEGTDDSSDSKTDDAAIRRQLQGDDEPETGIEYDLDADSESVDQLTLHDATSGTHTPSRVGSSALPLQTSLPTSTSTHIPVETPSQTLVKSASILPATNVSAAGRVHPAWAQAVALQNRAKEDASDTNIQNGHSKRNGPEKSTCRAPLTQSHRGSSQIPTVASASSTNKRKRQVSKVKKGARQKQPKKQRSSSRQPDIKAEEEPADDEWEVKELLDDRWFLEQGVKVHRYLVLWEGDWPEDQNPTWEPAENVQDETLIKRYYQKKKAGLLKPPKKIQKTLHPYLSSRTQYSSVAEAFEGDIDEQTGPVIGEVESDTDQPDEKFVVTENDGNPKADGAGLAPSVQALDKMLARYNRGLARS